MAAISLFSVPKSEYADSLSVPTPKSLAEHDVQKTRDIDSYLIKRANEYGSPIGYIQEQNGVLVQNLFPIVGNETRQISSSSKVQLELHTETAFHPWKPDFLMLFCLRGDRTAETTISLLVDILGSLSSKTIEILKEPRFSTSIDVSFQNENQPDKVIRMSVLSEDCSTMTFDQTLMRGNDIEAQDALERFRQAVYQNLMGLTLDKGDLLVIDNHRAIHGRGPFAPRYDGTDRWLKRVMVRTELPPAEHMCGCVITTML